MLRDGQRVGEVEPDWRHGSEADRRSIYLRDGL